MDRGELQHRATADRLYATALASGLSLAEVLTVLTKLAPLLRVLLDAVSEAAKRHEAPVATPGDAPAGRRLSYDAMHASDASRAPAAPHPAPAAPPVVPPAEGPFPAAGTGPPPGQGTLASAVPPPAPGTGKKRHPGDAPAVPTKPVKGERV